MRVDDNFMIRPSAIAPFLEPYVPSEGSFLNAPVHTCFLKSFEGCCLRMRQSRLHAAFRKRPTSATSTHQKKFEFSFSNAIANRRNLLGTTQSAQLLQ